jgi:hypothetical protein
LSLAGHQAGRLGSSVRYHTMRKVGFLLCILGIPSIVSARGNQATWENLSTLQPGQQIQVVEMNSKSHSGSFLNVSSTTISLQEKGGEQTIQRQEVRSVKLMEHAHRLRNTLIGAAVGAGAGAGIGAGVTGRPGNILTAVSRAKGAGVGAALGVIGGAIIGALWPSHNMIYRA